MIQQPAQSAPFTTSQASMFAQSTAAQPSVSGIQAGVTAISRWPERTHKRANEAMLVIGTHLFLHDCYPDDVPLRQLLPEAWAQANARYTGSAIILIDDDVTNGVRRQPSLPRALICRS